MFPADVFYAEIIHAEGASNGTPFVCPKSWDGSALGITSSIETLFQELLCKDSYLGESIHAPYDFDIDVTIFGDLRPKIILLDDVFGDVGNFETHVFETLHRSHQVRILEVDCHVYCTQSRNYTIEKKLNGEDIDGGSAAIRGRTDKK